MTTKIIAVVPLRNKPFSGECLFLTTSISFLLFGANVNGKAILTYGSYNKHTHERLDTKFAQLVKERTGEDFAEKRYYIPEILFSKDGETVVNPPVIIHL